MELSPSAPTYSPLWPLPWLNILIVPGAFYSPYILTAHRSFSTTHHLPFYSCTLPRPTGCSSTTSYFYTPDLMPSYKRPECTLDVEEQYAYYDTWQLEPPLVAPDPIQEVAPAQAQPWASTSVEDTASIPALLTASPEPQPSEGTDAFFAAVNLMAEVEKLAEGRSQTSKLEMLAAVAVGFAQANERIYAES